MWAYVYIAVKLYSEYQWQDFTGLLNFHRIELDFLLCFLFYFLYYGQENISEKDK